MEQRMAASAATAAAVLHAAAANDHRSKPEAQGRQEKPSYHGMVLYINKKLL